MPAAPNPNTLGQQQRSAILDKAFALFARQGYRRTSFGDIAEEVGLSRPAIYHYFKNKDAVFNAVTERVHKDISLAIDRAMAQPGSLEEMLVGVFEARAGRDYALLFVSPHGRELLDERKRQDHAADTGSGIRVRAAMEELIRAAEKSGEINLGSHGLNVVSAVDLLDHFFEGLLTREPSETNASRAARSMVDIFVAGLRITTPQKG